VEAIRLSEHEPARIGPVLWQPIRSRLGVRAFGINAYVAEKAGDALVPEHDETEAGAGRQRHEELYVVLTGRATVRGGGETVDAPAGTVVFFADPGERRSATAAEPGTTVLAVGGPAGEAYETPPWEYWLRARLARDRGDEDEARSIAEEGLARYPGEEPLLRILGRER
jgi:hypothetical protein